MSQTRLFVRTVLYLKLVESPLCLALCLDLCRVIEWVRLLQAKDVQDTGV